MNTIISTCVKKLYEISEILTELDKSNELSDGYNCAIFCINDGIETRVHLISKYCDETCDDNLCAIICLDQINSLVSVLNECSNDAEGLFKKGYAQAVSLFEEKAKSITNWLEAKAQI